MTPTPSTTPGILGADKLLEHWQGHRRLTRRVIDVFPEDKLFTFAVGGMRPFGEMATEFLKMAVPIVQGVATGKWAERQGLGNPQSKADLLKLWDEDTEALNQLWPTIPQDRFWAVDKAFGQWESPGIVTILYGIENEIHHRGQGYCYLRALGVEPPPFWERD